MPAPKLSTSQRAAELAREVAVKDAADVLQSLNTALSGLTEEEVAARIVNKQRSEYGETKREKKKDSQGKSPDRNLPIANYQHKTISEVRGKLSKLSKKELNEIDRYESKHKDRKGIHEAIEQAKAA